MLVKGEENRDTIEMVSLDMLVPKEHLLRKIDAAVDFHRIYEFVDDLYCKNNGRPSIIHDVLHISSKILIEKLENLLSVVYGDLCAPKLFDIYDTCNTHIYQMI